MVGFPILLTLVLLVLLAALALSACTTCGGLVRERQWRLSRPAVRLVLLLTVVEVVLVLAWGLVLRPR